jgi:GNAT superfamily N-acetyltransferase
MGITIRRATREDSGQIFALVQALAEYEGLTVTGSQEELETHLFGDRPFAEALLAEWEGTVAGFALYFYNYSTFLTKPGIYLEDLFVLPAYRRRGIATALLQELKRIAKEQNCGRLEWSVLEWNQSAIAFYESMGAQVLPDWRICRIVL